MRSVWRSERGTVTAELALLLPIIVGVLAVAIGALRLMGVQMENTVLVGDWARSLSRGAEFATVHRQVDTIRPGAQLSAVQQDQILCIKLTEPVTVPLWSALIPRLEVSTCVPTP